MDVGLSCVAKQTARRISPALLQLINFLNNITQHYLNIGPTLSQITSPSVFIPYFDVQEENEKNSFSFIFSIHATFIFNLQYNRAG